MPDIKFERQVNEAILTKVDAEEKRVFGIFSLTKKNGEFLIDKQDDIIHPKDLEEAAYSFVLKARVAGVNHTKMGVGRLIESMVFTKEKMQVLQDTLKKIGVKSPKIDVDAEFWYGGFQVDDPVVWDMVKSGELVSFSIGGKTKRYLVG